MLTAVVAHPPVFGARLKSVDDSAAKGIKSVKAVLRIPVGRGGEGVAVIADGYWPAKQGRDALKLDWDTSSVEKVDSAKQLAHYRELATKAGPRKFDADVSALANAPHRIDAEFVFPYLAHAPMEPLNCTVSVAGASCVDANVAATAAIVLGPAATHWLTDRRLAARLVRDDGSVTTVGGWPDDEPPLDLAGAASVVSAP